MKILVTGSRGFVGRSLMWNLKEICEGRDRTRPGLDITEIFGYDTDSTQSELERACMQADFVFHFAGVNRPKDNTEFMEGNAGFSGVLVNMLKKYHNNCPVLLASSIQASLTGRFSDSAYGKSKLAAEELFVKYAEEMGAKVLIYRFPNIFGKWCRPNYNSAVATFCNAAANDLEYTVKDPDTTLELVYIDDLVREMLDALEGREHICENPVSGGGSGLRKTIPGYGQYCCVPVTHRAALREIVDLLHLFQDLPSSFLMLELPENSFAKKLCSTYLSYLPRSKMKYAFHAHTDRRGSFTELIKTQNCGQISVNVAKPGITRGQHWHNSKWEIFIVVSGHGLIQQRQIGTDPATKAPYPVIEFEVHGEQPEAVLMLPGYAHNIRNISKTENLVTIIWSNEIFDENRPDTYFELAAGEPDTH